MGFLLKVKRKTVLKNKTLSVSLGQYLHTLEGKLVLKHIPTWSTGSKGNDQQPILHDKAEEGTVSFLLCKVSLWKSKGKFWVRSKG
jgi:hypothetical protein